MGKEITLRLPDNVLSKIKDKAEKSNQSLDTYIVDILVNSVRNGGTDMASSLALSSANDEVEREKAAYVALHKTLLDKYPGHHVAIFNGEMVDHDVNGVALSTRVYQSYPDVFVLIRKVEQEPDPVLYFRSPRFEIPS